MNMVSAARNAEPNPSAATPRLELRQVSKLLNGTPIVAGIDLTVAPGESVVLLGSSGCGKTTTLRMVAGFIRPDSGEIHLSGKVASGPGVMVPTERRQLGMVFQNYAVWPHKTVFDNVAYGLVVARHSRSDIRDRVRRLLDVVQLGDKGDRLPSELSGGQQQRVALARAIATEPSLLLLDEPLSNLDAALRQQMRFELKELHKRIGTTMLYVTHDQEEALILADRLIVMNRGVVEQEGSPHEIYLRPRSRFVASFVGTTNLLEGRVKRKDAATGRIELEADCGITIRAGCHADTFAQLHEGATAAAAVRPEDIVIEPIGAPQPGGTRVKLGAAAFLGSRYELHLDVEREKCCAHVRTLDAFTDGVAEMRVNDEAAWIVP
jgi:ABC-type Fe3+/spermidine/putrescine transport system ATPase subunit